MKTWECKECGSEIQSAVKPSRPCKCGARGKWKEVEKPGTPKTLRQAIVNGLEAVNRLKYQQSAELEAGVVRQHVQDFLAQKFGAAMLIAQDKEIDLLQNLWTSITLGGK